MGVRTTTFATSVLPWSCVVTRTGYRVSFVHTVFFFFKGNRVAVVFSDGLSVFFAIFYYERVRHVSDACHEDVIAVSDDNRFPDSLIVDCFFWLSGDNSVIFVYPNYCVNSPTLRHTKTRKGVKKQYVMVEVHVIPRFNDFLKDDVYDRKVNASNSVILFYYDLMTSDGELAFFVEVFFFAEGVESVDFDTVAGNR